MHRAENVNRDFKDEMNGVCIRWSFGEISSLDALDGHLVKYQYYKCLLACYMYCIFTACLLAM